MSQGEEFAEDTRLHLFGGLVGEGHGEGVAEVLRVRHQQFDVFQCQSVGLAAAGAGLKHGQPRGIFHGHALFLFTLFLCKNRD